MIVLPALFLFGTSNHGRKPSGARAVSPLVSNSMTPSGVQKRNRVIAFTMTRSLSAPLRSSVHRSGREP
jgi:hypothetical protein